MLNAIILESHMTGPHALSHEVSAFIYILIDSISAIFIEKKKKKKKKYNWK